MAGTTGRSSGARALRIDRAVYLLDEETKTYRYLRRNPDWESLDPRENERNKRHLNGFTRIFSDGRAAEGVQIPAHEDSSSFVKRAGSAANSSRHSAEQKKNVWPATRKCGPDSRATTIPQTGSPDISLIDRNSPSSSHRTRSAMSFSLAS